MALACMNEDLKDLLEKNIALSEQIAKDVRKMRHHFWMTNVWGILKIVLFVVVPLVAGYIYLQPYVKKMQEMYQQVLEIQAGVEGFQKDLGELQKNVGKIGVSAPAPSGANPAQPTPAPDQSTINAILRMLGVTPR